MLSEVSLLCFLADLRLYLACFEGHMPEGLSFINISSFFLYFRDVLPMRCNQVQALLTVLSPYIPIILSQKSFGSLVSSYMEGDHRELDEMERRLIERSQIFFVKSALKKTDEDWQSLLDICCQIRNHKEQSLQAGHI